MVKIVTNKPSQELQRQTVEIVSSANHSTHRRDLSYTDMKQLNNLQVIIVELSK